MSQRTRTRWLAVWLALATALAVPLGGWAAEDEESQGEEEAAAEDEGEEAEEEDEGAPDWEVTHRGLYLIGQGGYAFVLQPSDLEDEAADAAQISDVDSHVDDSWAYGGRIGYRLMERVAIEGQFELLHEIAIHQNVPSGNARSDATFLTATGNVKGYLLTQRFQPYLLGGVGYGHSEIDPPGSGTSDRDNGLVARFGVGTDFYVTDSLGLMTELAYVLPTGGVSDFDNLVIGFGFVLRIEGGE